MVDGDRLAVAKQLFDAIEQGDLAQVAACYSDDVTVWHNYDRIEQARAENLTVLKRMIARTTKRRYNHRRLRATPDGFVQQHVLCMTRRDDAYLELEACMVCRVEGARITRIEEYFDPRPLAEWLSG